jgi:hypothetical protein
MVWQTRAQGELTESIAFVLAHLSSPFSAQKSLVKPQYYLSHCQTGTSEWHFSYAQTAILDIELKNSELKRALRANSFR